MNRNEGQLKFKFKMLTDENSHKSLSFFSYSYFIVLKNSQLLGHSAI